MSVFTYTVKRSIESNGFDETYPNEVEVSVGATTNDDYFHFTSTTFSGLSSGVYIDVSGFSNADNNGWHLIVSTTASKIYVESSLVSEAVASSVSIKGYYRGLDTSNTIEKSLSRINYGIRHEKRERTSLGLVTEVFYFGHEERYEITTVFVSNGAIDEWKEFINSVAAGEAFTFDPYGTETLNVILDGQPSFERIGNSTYWSISFGMKVL